VRAAIVAEPKQGKQAMKKVTFTGSLSDVEKQRNEWRTANPHVKIVFDGAPMRMGRRGGFDVFQKTDWSLTVTYEDN
jgi:hypothetical protein